MILTLLFAACTGMPVDSDDLSPTDSGAGDTADSADSGDTGDTPSRCDELGLPERPWDPSGVTAAFDEVVPDLTLAGLDDTTITLSELWSGCEAVAFVVLRAGYPSLDTKMQIRTWMEGAPATTHWVFLVDEGSEAARVAQLDAFRAEITDIADKEAESADFWASHAHYSPEKFSNTDTWIDEIENAWDGYPLNLGVDRLQRLREFGSLADPATGWETAPATFLNYEARHWAAQAALQDRLDAQTATVIRAFDNTGERQANVELPDAATMATFDTLELDMQFICNGHPDTVGCGEWDYLAYAYLCDETDTCTEIARYITAYARPGRWVVDATPFLALMSSGGTHSFRVDSANAPLITLDLRFSNQGRGTRPLGIEYLYSGGSFNESYNATREPHTFTPPEGTTRVEVMALVTGHGYGKDVANCAEFCNHEHEFTVNGADSWTLDFPEADVLYGCADQIEAGTVPNQYGTWILGRGGWCPGKQVDPWSADITASVDLTGPNELVYRGLYEGVDYVPEPYDSGSGFGAGIVANTWLVYWQ
ncbi:MAG: hypothetical protein EXR71_16825 [Myxococcales bacterium]|nr:hypothetical protein [Myxococcales bacterium]